MICLYAICKNEEKNVQQFVNASTHFDETVVLDTGSTDQTINILKASGINVAQRIYENFDFSIARNDAMSLASNNVDWFFSLDFNENLYITADHLQSINSSSYDGFTVNCGDYYDKIYQEKKLKIHKKGKFIWMHAVHEYLVPFEKECNIGTCDVKITKHTYSSANKSQFYVNICEREHQKNKNDPHYSWWVLSYYDEIQDYDKLLYHATNYLDNTIPYNNEFRIYSFIYASKACVKKNKMNTAIDLGFHALSESIKFRGVIPTCFERAITHLNKIGIEIKYKDINR
jgi:glycosyltransferase involved in cell wall biosynthesis